MVRQGYWTIKDAALMLGVNEMTIRRHIKAHKVEAKKTGNVWRVTGIPDELIKGNPQTAENDKLYEDNKRMAYELGLAHAEIARLKEEVKLLEAPARPPHWWQRLFRRR